jgi:hypothetical protein
MLKQLNLHESYSHADFEELLQKVITAIRLLSAAKGGEYAGGNDRLANFRRNALQLGVPAEIVWAVYAGKHWDAIQQYVKDIANKQDRPRTEEISGRAHDLIVYLILFIAMEDEKATKQSVA